MGPCFLRGNSVKVKIFYDGVDTFDLMNTSDSFRMLLGGVVNLILIDVSDILPYAISDQLKPNHF